MKTSLFQRAGLGRALMSAIVPVAALLLASAAAMAQYKAPSQYFRKDSPGVNRGGGGPGQPGQPGAPSAPEAPKAPAQPRFKDVSLNSQFFFLVDTNRAYPWTKVTATTAKNAQGVTRAINVETLVRQ